MAKAFKCTFSFTIALWQLFSSAHSDRLFIGLLSIHFENLNSLILFCWCLVKGIGLLVGGEQWMGKRNEWVEVRPRNIRRGPHRLGTGVHWVALGSRAQVGDFHTTLMARERPQGRKQSTSEARAGGENEWTFLEKSYQHHRRGKLLDMMMVIVFGKIGIL